MSWNRTVEAAPFQSTPRVIQRTCGRDARTYIYKEVTVVRELAKRLTKPVFLLAFVVTVGVNTLRADDCSMYTCITAEQCWYINGGQGFCWYSTGGCQEGTGNCIGGGKSCYQAVQQCNVN